MNSTSVAQVALKHGDVIRVGSVDLVFEDLSLQVKEKVHSTAAPGAKRPTAKIEPPPKPIEELSSFEGEVFTESQAALEMIFDTKKHDDRPHDRASAKRRQSDSAKPNKRQLRPGEQEVLKSPLVLGLFGAGLILLLVTGVFWFLIARERATQLYDQAVAEMNGGQYSQSIASFERFLEQYPNHVLRRQADIGVTKANILRDISGAAPQWQRGLERLNDLIRVHRNDSDFSDLRTTLFQFAEQIALGSAKSSESGRDPELLVISKESQNLLERYADPATPPVGTIARIAEQRLKAERAIDKQRTFDIAMVTIDKAIGDQKPMLALSERERLVRMFPEFANSKRVKDALQKSMDLEKSVVSIDDSEVAAETTDEVPFAKEPVLGILHSRSRTDEASQGRVVLVVAKDSCYAVDSTTGETVWRRVIGADCPFFPVTTTGALPSVLLFDTRKQSMLACQMSSGKLIWRQSLNARVKGPPLVHEGQIYQALDGKTLVRLDVDSGKITARVKFSQNLASSPALSRDGTHLLVPGDMAMVYSLTLHSTAKLPSLAVVATTFTDHAAGSVATPPLSMGRLLLVCENDRADSARLRLWDAGNPTESLPELASARTTGQVRDLPVLRGNQLVVPSAGEQFAAFAVSDDAGKAGIATIGQYRADQARISEILSVPLFVALGSDGQFWSAGTAFRRFEIVSDSIRMDSNSSAPGIASQPLQSEGDVFFVGRKSRFSDAVTFSSIEREKLVNPWRCILGDAPLELQSTREDGVVWIGESGTIYSLSKARLTQGGIELKAGVDLELPVNVTKPIRATVLSDQRFVVAAAGDTKSLTLLSSSGQVVGKYPLNDMLEADPVLLDDGLVLPLPGRLKLLSLNPGKKAVQDWIAPIGEAQERRWGSLFRIGERELISCEPGGLVTRFQLRQGDVPHIAEVASLQLDQPVVIRPVLRGEFLYIADAAGNCRQFNVHSFDTDGQSNLPEPIKQVWSVDDLTLVHAGDGKLHALTDGKILPEKWNFDLDQLIPIGPALAKDDSIWLACRNGTVLILDSKSGQEKRRIQLPQALSLGLRQLKEGIIAVAVDATIYRVE